MNINSVLATVAVTDFEKSASWYGRLFGRSADRRPVESRAEWQVAEGATIQVLQKDAFTDKKDRADWGSVALIVDSLDEVLAGLKARDVSAEPVEVFPGFVKSAAVRDPDGNVVTFVESISGAQ